MRWIANIGMGLTDKITPLKNFFYTPCNRHQKGVGMNKDAVRKSL